MKTRLLKLIEIELRNRNSRISFIQTLFTRISRLSSPGSPDWLLEQKKIIFFFNLSRKNGSNGIYFRQLNIDMLWMHVQTVHYLKVSSLQQLIHRDANWGGTGANQQTITYRWHTGAMLQLDNIIEHQANTQIVMVCVAALQICIQVGIKLSYLGNLCLLKM